MKIYGSDLGMRLEGNAFTDSSATLGIANRTGLGRMTHLHTQSWRVQEAQRIKRLACKKVKGAHSPADMVTKYVRRPLINCNCDCLMVVFSDGRASSAPSLNVLDCKKRHGNQGIPQQLLKMIGHNSTKKSNDERDTVGERLKARVENIRAMKGEVGRKAGAGSKGEIADETGKESPDLEIAKQDAKSERENLENVEMTEGPKESRPSQRWICKKGSKMGCADVDEEEECKCEE